MAKILIVEDELSINRLIQKILQLVGHTCTAVMDGDAAIHKLDFNSYDLILLDIMLPGVDGYRVFQESRGTPTIFLTARSGLTDRLKGLGVIYPASYKITALSAEVYFTRTSHSFLVTETKQ